MPWSNRGKYNCMGVWLVNVTRDANYYVALLTSAAAVTTETNTMADVTQVATGNGYSDGGIQLTPGATDFSTYEEDETNNRCNVKIKDLVWTASSGNLPGSGAARYAAFTGPHGTVSSRNVYAGWDLVSDRVVSVGQTLTLQNLELRLA